MIKNIMMTIKKIRILIIIKEKMKIIRNRIIIMMKKMKDQVININNLNRNLKLH